MIDFNRKLLTFIQFYLFALISLVWGVMMLQGYMKVFSSPHLFLAIWVMSGGIFFAFLGEGIFGMIVDLFNWVSLKLKGNSDD